MPAISNYHTQLAIGATTQIDTMVRDIKTSHGTYRTITRSSQPIERLFCGDNDSDFRPIFNDDEPEIAEAIARRFCRRCSVARVAHRHGKCC